MATRGQGWDCVSLRLMTGERQIPLLTPEELSLHFLIIRFLWICGVTVLIHHSLHTSAHLLCRCFPVSILGPSPKRSLFCPSRKQRRWVLHARFKNLAIYPSAVLNRKQALRYTAQSPPFFTASGLAQPLEPREGAFLSTRTGKRAGWQLGVTEPSRTPHNPTAPPTARPSARTAGRRGPRHSPCRERSAGGGTGVPSTNQKRWRARQVLRLAPNGWKRRLAGSDSNGRRAQRVRLLVSVETGRPGRVHGTGARRARAVPRHPAGEWTPAGPAPARSPAHPYLVPGGASP